MDVEPECLGDIVAMLKQFDISVTGSKDADGIVCLSIEGPMVPDLPKVTVGVHLTVKGRLAMLTATCDMDTGNQAARDRAHASRHVLAGKRRNQSSRASSTSRSGSNANAA
ncbi:MAG: hypothetical protein JWQ74_3518 [Marmoricola sp.]|nr:hypothetical protein [Marmoricola sp.]